MTLVLLPRLPQRGRAVFAGEILIHCSPDSKKEGSGPVDTKKGHLVSVVFILSPWDSSWSPSAAQRTKLNEKGGKLEGKRRRTRESGRHCEGGEREGEKRNKGIKPLRMIQLDCLGFQEFVSVQQHCTL